MNLKFTCPTCRTRFKSDPEGRDFVFCPNCQSRLMVPPEVIQALADSQGQFRKKTFNEGGWIVLAAGGFVLVFVTIALVLYVSQSRQTQQTSTAPPPVAPIQTAPPPKPVVEEPPPPKPNNPPATTQVVIVKPKPSIRLGTSPSHVTDQQIEAAARKGIDFLLPYFRNGELRDDVAGNEVERQGLNALMVYALLHCSQSINDPRISITSEQMQQMIERMKKHDMQPTEVPRLPVVYARSLRSCALAVYGRTEDKDALNKDVQWLINASHGGAYQYDDYFTRPGSTGPLKPGEKATPPSVPAPRPGVHNPEEFSPDNSNSQYGLLGVWTAAESGVSVPQSYWEAVERYWTNSQAPNGMWDYGPTGTQGSYPMTMAGLTALSVTRDYLPVGVGTSAPESRDAAAQALKRAIDWFQRSNNAINVSGSHWGYSLYGLERAALATGLMYAGGHDLYRELAIDRVKDQLPTGSWMQSEGRDACINTSFVLLFLTRGKHPVMMQKLAYNGKWDLRPRDLSLLTRYCSYAMENPMNWQNIDLSQDWQQWLDAPILYIAGSKPIEFTESDLDKLRNYVNAGGLIFTNSDLNSKDFNAFFARLADKLFPQFPVQDMPADDDFYKMVFPTDAKQYPMKMVTNGARRLMIHSVNDVSAGWVSRAPPMRQNASRVAINLLVFASGRGPLRSRTTSLYVPPPPAPVYTLPVVQVKYDGNWNPEPYAWQRLSNLLGWEIGWLLDFRTVEANVLDLSNGPVAHLTGVEGINLNDEEIRHLSNYVRDGGVLLIDPVGGKKEFKGNLDLKLLGKLFPGAAAQNLSGDHPIRSGEFPGLTDASTALGPPDLRTYSLQIAKPKQTEVSAIRFGKGVCIIAPVDITTALLGTNAWNVNGYEGNYASKLAKHIMLYAATREPPK